MPGMRGIRAAARVAVIALCAAGCGGATARETAEPATDTATAARGARELVKEIYGGLRRGATGGMLALVEPGVVAIGPGPTELFTERSAALVALGEAVPEGKHKLVSTDLRVGASPTGHAAWASDVVVLDGKSYSVAVIMTETDELWTVAEVVIGRPVPKKQLAAALAGTVPVPVLPPPAVAPRAPDGATEKAIVAELAAATASPLAIVDAVRAEPPTVVRDLTGKALGPKAFNKRWKKSQKGVTTASRPNPEVRIAPDGSLAWVIGLVDVTGAAAGSPAVPTRIIAVYDRTDSGWQLALVSSTLAP
jgi:ketosteroid isomerase-like protein